MRSNDSSESRIVLTVDKTSGEPAYIQLIRQIKRDVVLGVRRAGDRLPTTEELAKALNMARQTVGQAYRELQKEKVIETRKSRGSFILPPHKGLLQEFARTQLAPAVLECKRVGLSRPELVGLFEQILAAQFVERNRASDRRTAERTDVTERRGIRSNKG